LAMALEMDRNHHAQAQAQVQSQHSMGANVNHMDQQSHGDVLGGSINLGFASLIGDLGNTGRSLHTNGKSGAIGESPSDLGTLDSLMGTLNALNSNNTLDNSHNRNSHNGSNNNVRNDNNDHNAFSHSLMSSGVGVGMGLPLDLGSSVSDTGFGSTAFSQPSNAQASPPQAPSQSHTSNYNPFGGLGGLGLGMAGLGGGGDFASLLNSQPPNPASQAAGLNHGSNPPPPPLGQGLGLDMGLPSGLGGLSGFGGMNVNASSVQRGIGGVGVGSGTGGMGQGQSDLNTFNMNLSAQSTGKSQYDLIAPEAVPEMTRLTKSGLSLYGNRSETDWAQYSLRLTSELKTYLNENNGRRLEELKSISGCEMAIKEDFLMYYRDSVGHSCHEAMRRSLKVLNSWLN